MRARYANGMFRLHGSRVRYRVPGLSHLFEEQCGQSVSKEAVRGYSVE